MPSYDVRGGKVIGAPDDVQKQFDDLMGENRQWAKDNPDKLGGKDDDEQDRKDRKRPR